MHELYELFVPACDGNKNPISFVPFVLSIHFIMVVAASLSSFYFIFSLIF